ncbi:hypothetical protein HWV62_40691 [Athelia sp. TMB]|nr:hypothetical protein HWV62_40691 [Athelia sp. TMB]
MTIFNTYDTLGGTVNNVNRDFIQGDYIVSQVNYFQIISDGSIPEPSKPLERFPDAYYMRTPGASTSTASPQPLRPHHSPLTVPRVMTSNFQTHKLAQELLIKIRVITDIMDALMDNPSLRHSETLPKTLDSLRRMLTLAELTVRMYQQTPLASTLSHVITVQVELCRRLLLVLLKDLANYRHVLPAAMLHFIRKYIWNSVGESTAVSDLDSKLKECHSSLAACILALGR